MTAIWKYQLPLTDEPVLNMPVNAKIIHVDDQHGVLCLWAEVDRDEELVPFLTMPRQFYVVGTGHTFDRTGKRYLGSVIQDSFVWHVYERSVGED